MVFILVILLFVIWQVKVLNLLFQMHFSFDQINSCRNAYFRNGPQPKSNSQRMRSNFNQNDLI